MQSPAKYTCRRCLIALKSSPRPTMRGIPSQRRIELELSNRPISTKTSNGPASSIAKLPAQQTRRRDVGKRSVSTVGSQGQIVGNESPQVRNPPGIGFTSAPEASSRPLLLPNNLFHPFSRSPVPEIRRRAAFMKQHAFCPHPDHSQTRMPTGPDDPEARKAAKGALPPAHVSFECPDCGIPVSCSEEHWADDYEAHLEVCDTLREVNEDDHDLHSGRFFPEFEYPPPQIEEAMVNMTNWDTYLYSREFKAINDERSLRQATKLLTYPITIGSVLHELSPYNIRSGGRLTVEGLKSLSGMFDPAIIYAKMLNIMKLFDTHYTLPKVEQALVSKVSDPIHHPCVSSFSVLEQNHLCPEKSGSNYPTSSPEYPST
jgi:splicing suppressor protein 51